LQGRRFPLHRQNGGFTTPNAENSQEGRAKIVEILSQLRNIG
jgi:hypothetical protein